MKLKPLNLGKPRLKQVLMPLAAITLRSGASQRPSVLDR